MRMKAHLGLAVGPADENHWGQVLVTPTGYGIVEIADASGEAQKKGARILSHLGEKLSHELTSLTSVEDAVSGVWEKGIVSLMALVPVGRVVYLVLRGSGSVYVRRGMELASLMHTEGGISGEVREKDTILLVSHGFSRMLTRVDILGVFDHLPSADVAEKLTLLLHEKPGGEGSVALVFDVHFEETTSPPNTQPEETKEAPLLRRRTVFRLAREKGISAWRIIRSFRHDPKRLTRFGAMIITSLFFISVAVGIWKQTVAKKNQYVASVLSDARHVFEEGVALLELNPVKGRERLDEAKTLLTPLMSSLNTRTKEGRDVKVLYDRVNDNLTQSLQITEGVPNLFYDMELMKKGARATSITLKDTSLIVGDEVGATVYRLDITSKKADVVAGGELFLAVSSVALHGDTVYALTPSGVVATTFGDKKPAIAVSKDDAWGSISSLVSFGANLYLLDTVKSRIWKYVAVEKALPTGDTAKPSFKQGFSDIHEYLNPDTLPDLSIATGMTIDGAVWVGTKRGTILRFVQGREETFVPKGVEPELGTDLVVYVTDETKNLYVLDRVNNRVVVLDKDGVYVAQYRFSPALADAGQASGSRADSIAVSEEHKKILLLLGGKIYSVDLK